MLLINKLDYFDALNYVQEFGRKLDCLLLKNLSVDQKEEVLIELLKYQNSDGGFGNALEPDLRVPNSTAIATEFAINIISDLDILDDEVISSIIKYLESTYDPSLRYWKIVPPSVDNHPRAIWWNYNNIEGFGRMNPTTSLIGFIYKHAKGNSTIDLDYHINDIVSYINERKVDEFESHELLCLMRFNSYMPKSIQEIIDKKLNDIIEHIIEKDPKKWGEYCPLPVSYINYDNLLLMDKYIELIKDNLDFIVESRTINKVWLVKHQWYQFEEDFIKTAKSEWTGFITYENMKILKSFKRLVL
jgi:hypothetical protein